MMVIGITGGSGAGKSVACKYLCARGGLVINCDKVYASLVDTPSSLTKMLSKEFGPEILKADGSLDRKTLSSIVFGSESKEPLKRLNAITHPAVIAEVKRLITEGLKNNIPYFLVDAPQLFEAGADSICDCTVCVTADKEKRCERIVARDSISNQSAMQRISSQLSDDFFFSRCDYTILNNGTEDELAEKCFKLLDLLEIHDNGNDI